MLGAFVAEPPPRRGIPLNFEKLEKPASASDECLSFRSAFAKAQSTTRAAAAQNKCARARPAPRAPRLACVGGAMA